MKIGDKIETIKNIKTSFGFIRKGSKGEINYIPSWSKNLVQIKFNNGNIDWIFLNEIKILN